MRKPKISVVIAYRNDPYINYTLAGLGVLDNRIEVIVIDDASDEPYDCPYDGVRVIRNSAQRGVGYSFDIGVLNALSPVVVLMGSDIMISDSKWCEKVIDYVSKHPKGIGCSVCLSGDPTHLNPDEPANDIKRYGGQIIPLCTTENLPSDSTLLEHNQYYVGAWDVTWHKKEPKEDIAEISCVYGAMYFTSKSWYQYINGWDSVEDMKLSGHRSWGSLEPWLSLKNFLCGGMCHVVKNIESLHIFHKYPLGESPHGRTDFFWYNKMFISYSMLEEEDAENLLKKIYELRSKYELYTLPFNLGRKLIRQNWEYVSKIREGNRKKFVYSFEDFCRHFNIDKKW